jgi:hypothetical protein
MNANMHDIVKYLCHILVLDEGAPSASIICCKRCIGIDIVTLVMEDPSKSSLAWAAAGVTAEALVCLLIVISILLGDKRV